MKVIFLDIDGVLNSTQESVSENILGTFNYQGLSRTGIGLLRKLVELTGACIVISSAWRGDGHDPIAGAFEAHGWRGIVMRKIIIGVTPHLNTIRGAEIDDWLTTHPEVTNYVIIDDDSDMLGSQKNNFVKTDNVTGFNLYDMVKAMDILSVVDDPVKVKRADDLRKIVQFKLNKRAKGDHGYSL